MWEFFSERVELESWQAGVPPVEVELEPPEVREAPTISSPR
jgi:hypothetical protein